MKAGVSAHQRGATLVFDCTAYRGADGWQWIALGGDEPNVVSAPSSLDSRLDATPQQHAMIRRLPSATGIERRPIQHDAVIVDVQHRCIPLTYRGIEQVESLRVVACGHSAGLSLPLGRDGCGGAGGSLGIEVLTPGHDRTKIGIEAIHQGNTGRDVETCDVCIGYAIEVLDQRPQ